MIVIDKSEQRVTSNMPDVPDAVTSTILEKLTGADVMVSAGSFPPKSEMLIRRHINEGAILVQRKSGRDLVSSVGPRMNTSLAKMFEVNTPFSGQRILLTTGIFISNEKGECMIGEIMTPKASAPYVNWSNTGRSYKAVRTAFQNWNIRGGVSMYSLAWNGEIPSWLMALEENLIKNKGVKTKEIFEVPDFPDDPPLPTDVLQLPRRVSDFRRVLVAHDGIGPKSANALWEYTNGNPWGCIEVITGGDTGNVKGIGKKTVEKNRKLWGLDEGMQVSVFYPSDFVSEDYKEED